MSHRLSRIAFAAVVALLVAVPVAAACSLVVHRPADGPVMVEDVRVPTRHSTVRAAWRLRPGWRSVRPSLNAVVDVETSRGSVQRNGVTHAGATSIAVTGHDARGALQLVHDTDDATPPCALNGARAWTKPRLLTRQTGRAVFLTMATRPTPGDRTGCVVARTPFVTSCHDVAFGVVRLRAALGDRRVVMQWFAA